jgi:hypothetical protein
VTVLDARILQPPRLSFDPAIPSRVGPQAYSGLLKHGPYDTSQVHFSDHSLLFMFPESHRDLARRLVMALGRGYKNFPGFSRMFRVPFASSHVDSLVVSDNVTSPSDMAISYRNEIARWNSTAHEVPKLAMVLVPHSERWQVDRPYYEAKASFAKLGIPTQMVTTELMEDEREFTWSVANIALATFAKLGGIPWVVESPANDHDLVIGIGRADIRKSAGVYRIFGYALTFTSNGSYRQNWSFTPAADEATYLLRLEQAIEEALTCAREADERFRRLVIHLGKKTGKREAIAARNAMSTAGFDIPLVLVRIDDSSMYDIADGQNDMFAPPKGLAVRLNARQILLQPEGVSAVGPPSGPLLIELDEQSDVGVNELEDVAAQVFRLAHANWRAFNARSQPVTLCYGELLARLVGYLEEVEAWDPSLLRSDLRDRPWFL